MSRRLPVYIVADCSGSMAGDPIEAVNRGIRALHSSLMGDPSAIEFVWLSLITFADNATQVSPLTEVCDFVLPVLQAGGQKRLGAALELLTQCVDREVSKATPVQKGDWKPVGFLMTNGVPTDSWEGPAQKMRAKRLINIIGVACGAVSDTSVLKRITETVLNMKDMSSDCHQFFKWVSCSIKMTSCKISSGTEDTGALPPPPPGISIVP